MRVRLGILVFAMVAAILPPAAYAQETWFGLACGFQSSNDSTGFVDENPDHQTGDVSCLFWLVVDDGTRAADTADSLTLQACFTINNSGGFGTGVCVTSVTLPLGASTLVSTVTYTATAADEVYLCTTASWTGTKGSHVFNVDVDGDSTNGDQCALATSAGGIATNPSARFVLPTVVTGP